MTRALPPTQAVVFDAIGTLLDPAPVRRRLVELGAPEIALEAWFHRTLHAAAAMTLAGRFHAFADLATASAAATLAQLGLDAAEAPSVAAATAEMGPRPGAEAAVVRLREAGLPVAVLTNGGREQTARLLGRAGLDRHLEAVVSVEEVGVYKPHPRTYGRVLERLGVAAGDAVMVAAHGWDCAGAAAAGMSAVWVRDMERAWPMPGPEPPSADDLEGAAALIVVPDGPAA